MQPLQDIVPTEVVFQQADQRGRPIPWWLKMSGKMVLSRLLPSYRMRSAVGLFVHTHSEDAARAAWFEKIVANHVRFGNGEIDTVLELGPGDSLGMALFAAAHGARQSWLIDVGDFASGDMNKYAAIARLMDEQHPGFSSRVNLSSRAEMLASVRAGYLTGGMESLAGIASGSVDLVTSLAVLEHVRRAEFATVMAETFRVLRPGGTAQHQIDLSDHLGGALNSLRFSDRVWEHPLVANAGFYTNRLRFSEIVDIAQCAGFQCATMRFQRWPQLPISRLVLARRYRDFPDHELDIASFHVLLRKPDGIQ